MLYLCRYRASLISITESAPTTASDCRRPTTSTDRAVSRKRCGRTRFIEEMSRVCRLIHNFADDSFRCCQLFQEKVNLFSKGVNDSSKVSARLCRFVCKELIRENACQPHQEKYQKLSARLCRFACKEPKSGKDRQKSHQFINSSIHQMPFSELAIFRCLILYIIYIL